MPFIYFSIFNRAALHSDKIIFFIRLAPVNNFVQLGFENQIQRNAGTAAVTLRKGWAIFTVLVFSAKL